MLHKHLYGFNVIYPCIFAHEPPYQTYSSVGQPGFRHHFSAHKPPYEISRLSEARPIIILANENHLNNFNDLANKFSQ